MALLMACLLFLIALLLIAILIRTRARGLPAPLLLEEDEDTVAALPPVIVRRAPWIGLDEPRISKYPLIDLRRRINGLTPMLNIPPAPLGPIAFSAPNGAHIGRGPHFYK